MPYREAQLPRVPPTGNFSFMTWECLERFVGSTTDGPELHVQYYELRRARIAGGWLVESRLMDQHRDEVHTSGGAAVREGVGIGQGSGLALTFVPDPTWSWDPNLT